MTIISKRVKHSTQPKGITTDNLPAIHKRDKQNNYVEYKRLRKSDYFVIYAHVALENVENIWEKASLCIFSVVLIVVLSSTLCCFAQQEG